MKNKTLFLLLITIPYFSYTQTAPEIEWQNTIGGSLDDLPEAIEETKDGGYIIGGISYSNTSGDKTEDSKGGDDFWVLKLDSLGNIQWQKTIGGESLDRLYSIHQTPDLGYILGGYSSSDSSGDKTEDVAGFNDYWVMKLDSIGNIEWQNEINATNSNYLYVMPITSGGYLAAGCSNSDIAGDKTENSYGGFDFWLLKLNEIGEILWQKTIGGSEDENAYYFSLNETKDNGFILGGSSLSNISGLKEDTCRGGYDYWIIKLDSIGNIEWQKTIGGNADDYLCKVIQVFDEGYLIAGTSSSDSSGEKTENTIGSTDDKDYWILKLDNEGNILWQNTIGGSEIDFLSDAIETFDFGYLLGGYSFSDISGDKTGPYIGGYDYWVVKLDSIGNIQWQKTIGGTLNDILRKINKTNHGEYILIGYSDSGISGDKTEENIGTSDYWLVKLSSECTPIYYYLDGDADGFGSLVDSILACIEPSGYSLLNSDCNDENSTVHPGGIEICNLMDDNCNALLDEGLSYTFYYIDSDSDGYGNAEIDSISCLPEIFGYSDDSTDCNDMDASIYPGAEEIFNMIDDNCNEMIDEGFIAITEIDLDRFIEINPNPNDGNFRILFDSQFIPPFRIEIIDAFGNTIFYVDQIYHRTYFISLISFFSGLYTACFTNEFFTINKKIILFN